METVQIRCKAAVNLDIANLTPLQGDLKELAESNFNKLKQSILRHGITFPFFVWQSNGKNYILDGTQRDRVLTQMAEQGFHIPALPCALIDATDKREAAEKILLISSQYGHMTEASLDEFLAENDLSFLELADELELPSIDENYFKDPNEFSAADEDDQGRLDQKSPIQCPACGHQFVPR
jgi:ParB-like chromosome segregation protein Spo0J